MAKKDDRMRSIVLVVVSILGILGSMQLSGELATGALVLSSGLGGWSLRMLVE